MPSEGYKSIAIKVSTYETLKKLAEESGRSIVSIIDDLVKGKNIQMHTSVDTTNSLREVLNKISILEQKMEELNKKFDVLAKAIKQSQKRNFIDVIKDAFLGLTKPIKIKGKIEVSKGQIFLMEKIDIDVSEYNATIVEEKDENGNIVGYAIVPNLTFNTASEGIDDTQLEIWFDKYGVNLIKMLTKT